MSYRPKGKHVRIDQDKPDALGICDYSGFVFNRKDLVRQMEWRGQALVWTGFYVGRPFLDVPNPQLRPPILAPDPVPVIDPRLPQPSQQTWNTTQSIWNFTTDTWNDIDSLQDGVEALPENTRLNNLQTYNWQLQ